MRRLVGLVFTAGLLAACTGPHDGPSPRYLNISRSDVDSVYLGPAEGTGLQFDRLHARFNGTIPLSLISDYLPSRLPAPLCRASPPTGGVRVRTRNDREVVYSGDCPYPPEIRRLVVAMLRVADSYHPGPSPTSAVGG